jgi:YD repeat-containing protein
MRQPNGAVSPIQVPGASQTFVSTIKNAGDVVGYHQTATATHRFVFDGDGLVTIDVPGASSTEVTSINDHGELAGRGTGAHVFIARPQEQDVSEH